MTLKTYLKKVKEIQTQKNPFHLKREKNSNCLNAAYGKKRMTKKEGK